MTYGVNDDGSKPVTLTGSNVVQTDFKPFPFPPKLNPTTLDSTAHNGIIPKFRDNHGNWWASVTGFGLYKSTDYGDNWSLILANPNADAVGQAALIISDTGRAVWCTETGKVYVSDTAKTSWTLAFTFLAGHCDVFYGNNKYKNIILLSAYGTVDALNSPRQVYLSVDDGATFTSIYVGTNAANYHNHDVCYDPWADRVWLTQGDAENRQICYCDNYGDTAPLWKYVWNDGNPLHSVPTINGLQPTSIIPTPQGVFFGSDQSPDGFSFWKRPLNILQPLVLPIDIIRNYFVFDTNSTTTRHLLRGKSFNIENDKNHVWMVAVGVDANNTEGYGRILACVDGLNWFEVWKSKVGGGGGVQWVVAPDPLDEDRKFFAVTFYDQEYLLKCTLPNFTTNKPTVSIEDNFIDGTRALIGVISVTLPYSVAAGGFSSVATLDGLITKGVKRVTIAYKWASSISNQIYVNFYGSDGLTFYGSALTGAGTNSEGFKETNVFTQRMVITANNGSAGAVNLTGLEIYLWAQ